jgi:hypothetical protein
MGRGVSVTLSLGAARITGANRRKTVERLFAWLQRYRRILVRHEFHAAHYLGFVSLGCVAILS